MPKTENKLVSFQTNLNVDVQKYITCILIMPDTEIRWKIETKFHGIIKKTEWYCCPYSEMIEVINSPDVNFSESSYEELLFAKASEIDSMPTSTLEEIQAKNKRYGKGAKIILG